VACTDPLHVARIFFMEYVIVGSGARGATVGALLARSGHSVLVCNTDAERVAAINERGLSIEGPVEEFTVPVRAVRSEELPDKLGATLLAANAQEIRTALGAIAPRLGPNGFVVSLQSVFDEQTIASAIGRKRTVGALVDLSADYIGPSRVLLVQLGTSYVGELDGRHSERVARVAHDLGATTTDKIRGLLWTTAALDAMLLANAVSGLRLASGLSNDRYRSVFVRMASEVLAVATAEPEAFDGFDPGNLSGSIARLVERDRRSDKSYAEIWPDLDARQRVAEATVFDGIVGPLLGCTITLARQIQDARRAPEAWNLELLAAYARCLDAGRDLNAVIALLEPIANPETGPLHRVPVAIKDNIDVAGVVTTNASTAGVRPPAESDAPVVARLRAAGAELLCKTNLLEYAAGSVNPSYGMTFNPRDPSRTSGGSSGGSAALVGAGVVDYALGTDTGGSIRVPAAYCGIVGLKPTYGLVPVDGVTPLSVTLDHVGTLTRTVAQAARLVGAISGRKFELGSVSKVRVGVLRSQIDDPAVEPDVRACVEGALRRLARAGFEVVDVVVPELEIAAEAVELIVAREAFDVHRDLLELESHLYGSGTRALLEIGREVDQRRYEDALANQKRVADGFARIFERVDVLAGPTVPYWAPHEDPPVGTPEGEVEGRFTAPYNLARAPAISIPCRSAENELPAGLQLATAEGEDGLLLSVAGAVESFERA
jgi:Asp-tRNA(Asn)/Glu-tRNA(Gln) amidotransferase A subunit family amidase/ketopantoate reductase